MRVLQVGKRTAVAVEVSEATVGLAGVGLVISEAGARLASDELPESAQENTTIRHRAKRPLNLEVASEACMQAFGTSRSRKRLEDKPLETPQFSAGF